MLSKMRGMRWPRQAGSGCGLHKGRTPGQLRFWMDFRRCSDWASLAEPLIHGILVEPPVFADFLAGYAALLCELVKRRFRDFQVLGQFVDGEHAAATVGGHKQSLAQGRVAPTEVKPLLSVPGRCCQSAASICLASHLTRGKRAGEVALELVQSARISSCSYLTSSLGGAASPTSGPTGDVMATQDGTSPPLRVLALTGPHGSGCSTVAEFFDVPARPRNRPNELLTLLLDDNLVVQENGGLEVNWGLLNANVAHFGKDGGRRPGPLPQDLKAAFEQRELAHAFRVLFKYYPPQGHLFRTISVSDLIDRFAMPHKTNSSRDTRS